MGCGCRKVSISQKVQIFRERSILMKYSTCTLYRGLRGSIQFLIFEHFYMVLGRAIVWVKTSFLTENLEMDTGQFFLVDMWILL